MRSYCFRLMATVSAVVTAVVLASGARAATLPARQWLFNQSGTTTTAVDSTGNQDATLINFDFNGQSGWDHGTLHLDGSNDAVDAGSNTLGPTYTVTAWIKADSLNTSDQNVIFSQYDSTYPPGRTAFSVIDNKLSAWEGSGSGVTSGTTTLSTGRWYFAALSNDNKSAVGYLDGNQEFTKTYVFDPQNVRNTIGAMNADNLSDGGLYHGRIADLRVYNTALAGTDIQKLYAPTPIRRWKMDEVGTTTTAVDAAGNQNGTLQNFDFNSNSGWTAGKVGGALKFDGVDDVVTAGSGTVNSTFTVSAWINGDLFATSGDNVIVSQYDYSPGRFFLEVRDGQLAVFSGGGGGLPSIVAKGSTLNAGQWYHVTVTDDNNSVAVYLNGVLDFTTTLSYAPPAALNVIGGYYDPSPVSPKYDGLFRGMIDDLRIYDVALNAAQVENLYTAVPEPSAVTLAGCGVLGLLAYAWRKRRQIPASQ